MLVTELMTQFAHTVESSMAMSEAAELMRDHNVGLLPVLEGERLTGMLTDRDLVVRGLAEGKDPELTTIREIMTPRVATVFDDEDVDQAIQVMRDNRVRRVAVISHDRRLLGVLSQADLPQGHPARSELEEQAQDVPTTLNTPASG
jgi:CBS domain-containing protein